MAAPNVQIGFNDEVVKVMWVLDDTGAYGFFNLYYDSVVGMGTEALVASNIPNIADTYYAKDKVTFCFRRSAIGMTNDSEFYLRLKGVSPAGVEDIASPGATRIIPSLTAQRDEYNATQIYGYDTVKSIWKRVKVNNDGSLA
jgi:hypothetical protein